MARRAIQLRFPVQLASNSQSHYNTGAVFGFSSLSPRFKYVTYDDIYKTSPAQSNLLLISLHDGLSIEVPEPMYVRRLIVTKNRVFCFFSQLVRTVAA
jgi:hypothetical protein